MNYFEFNSRWISDGIGDDYKHWQKRTIRNGNENPYSSAPRIFIESPTGTGKTTFIMNKLFLYAAEKGRHILYLGNRSALEKQTKNAVERNLIPLGIYGKKESLNDVKTFKHQTSKSTITILNYQSLLSFVKEIQLAKNNPPFYYVILDEVHFFLEDAMFNSMTGLILETIYNFFSNSVMIFMSATIADYEPIYELTKILRMPYHEQLYLFSTAYKEKSIKYKNLYNIAKYQPYIYQKDAELLREIKKGNPAEKWLVFVAAKKSGETLKKLIKKETNKSVLFIDATKKQTDEWQRLINKSSFEEDVLITTKVLDNGVNIIDSSVKNIVLPFCYNVDFMQMLGRKRFTEENEAVNLYIKQPTMQILNSKISQLNRLLNIIINFLFYTNTDEAMTKQLQIFFSKCDKSINGLFYIDANRDLVLNTLAYVKINLMIAFYTDLKDNYSNSGYFLETIKKWLSNTSIKNCTPIGLTDCSTLNDFIKIYLDKPVVDKEIFYSGFQQLYKLQCSKEFITDSKKLEQALSIRKGKTQRKATINKSLKMLNLPYEIKKEKNCWVLRKTE